MKKRNLLLAGLLGSLLLDRLLEYKEKNKQKHYGVHYSMSKGKMNVVIKKEGSLHFIYLPSLNHSMNLMSLQKKMEELKQLGKIVFFEYYGLGQSDDVEQERSLKIMSEEIDELRRRLNLDKVILISEKEGKWLALAYSYYFPQFVRSLIFMDDEWIEEKGWIEKVKDFFGMTRWISMMQGKEVSECWHPNREYQRIFQALLDQKEKIQVGKKKIYLFSSTLNDPRFIHDLKSKTEKEIIVKQEPYSYMELRNFVLDTLENELLELEKKKS